MKKKFPFEDFTLIMTRNCNLKCEYCPLDHFKGDIKKEVLDIFFEKISLYNNYDFHITLFGGEPLLNKKGIEYILVLFKKYNKQFINNNIFITFKIVTNGTLLNNEFIKIFDSLNSFKFIKLILNISIDGDRETQLKQRNYKKGYLDYYDEFKNNIHELINLNINIELGMVMSFFNNNIIKDIIYLVKEFKIPIFIMPVDLTLEYILLDKNIYINIKKYLIMIEKTLKIIEKNNLTKYIVNYSNEYRDIKIPPIGPTLDINGDIYATRDFLFTMDKNIKFSIIGNIKNINLIDYFFNNNIYDIEQKTLKLYYGRTLKINKRIGDYFTKLIYKI